MMKLKPLAKALSRSAAIASVAMVAATGVAHAQLEEIIVTAQKIEQSSQDVPISMRVVGAEELFRRNENEILALEKFDPSIRFAEGSQDQERTIRVRGVGTQNFSRGVEQSVAVVVDGVAAADAAAALADMSDIQRVEVLRGPQGLLFGKNASAGLINITTNRPTQEFEAGIGGSYGDEDDIQFNAFVSGGLTDTLAGRVSYYNNTRDPYLSNALEGGEDMNDRDEWGFRAKLMWDPTDDLNVLFSWAHSEKEQVCCSAAGVDVAPGGPADLGGAPRGGENDKIWGILPVTGYTDIDTYTVEANWDLDGLLLTSVTGYQEVEAMDNFRNFNTGMDEVVPMNRGVTNNDQFTQEFRIATSGDNFVDFVGGLYFFNKEMTRVINQQVDIGLFVLGLPQGTLGLAGFHYAESETSSAAGFGQLTWNFTEDFRLLTGLRYQHDTADVYAAARADESQPFATTLPQRPDSETDGSRSDNAVSYSLIVQYDLNDTTMLYAGVTQGYKGMGVNALGSVYNTSEPIIDAEIPINYEIGFKSDLLDNRVRLNATLFSTTFEDFQTAATRDNGDGTFDFNLASAGELLTEGLEVSLDAQVTDNLIVTAGYTYQDATYDDFKGAPCYTGQTVAQGCIGGSQDLSGTELAYNSKHNYTITGTYEIPLNSLNSTAYVNANYYWRDDHNVNAVGNPAADIDAYGIANASLGIRTDDGKYSLNLWVKNVFDEHYQVGFGDFFNGYYSNQYYLPYDYTRRIGIAGQVRF